MIKKIELLDDKDLEIKWRISHSCNIGCSYCIQAKKWQKPEDIKKEQIEIELLADDVNKIIEKHPERKNIKLQLIGGEVSIFDLKSLLNHFSRLNKLCITTNIIRDVDYYIDLADYCKSRNIFISITCSFHEEFIDLDSFIKKVELLKPHVGFITVEMVSVDSNQELVKNFIEKVHATDLDYMVDRDMRNIKDKQHLIACARKKNKPPKYKITYDDDTVKYFDSRNLFLTDLSTDTRHTQLYFNSRGYKCTHSYDYVYIDYDEVIGWSKDDLEDCRKHIPIKDFDLIESPRECKQKGFGCSLCGSFSLFKE